ncbi:MAG TPA: hypothetical protein VGU20_31445 [Stellaceae bacterium]|nr:hypothetical protein [Stellaceae bacterium]
MIDLLLGWAALLIILAALAIGRPGSGGALTLAYFIGLSLIHVPGAFIFTASDVPLSNRDISRLGFEMTILGMTAFVAGAVLARGISRERAILMRFSLPERSRIFERVGRRAIAAGALTYFIFIPFSFAVPSLTSVVSAFATLLILGFWLMLYGAKADQRRNVSVVAMLPLLPLTTLVTGGYLGYGMNWVVGVIAFLFVLARRRTTFYLVAPLVIYLGLSLFVTYMGQRTGIRDIVWRENSTLVDRIDRVSTIITQFQLIDFESQAHMAAIDDRLNQNFLVGLAIGRHESGWSDFAYGATVPIWALIPRAIWPDKPSIGGGFDVVSDFTGIHFDEGTSVGAGQVLEFYINFGVPGLVIGFGLLGFVLMRLDGGIMRSLASSDTRGLVLRAMPGLTLLQPGGNLLEIIVAAAAAFLGAHLILLLRLLDFTSRSERGNATAAQYSTTAQVRERPKA